MKMAKISYEKITQIYMLSGVGYAPNNLELLSFDRALRAANCADYNLSRLSSVLPPMSEVYLGKKSNFPKGAIVPTVYSFRTSSHEGQRIACCVAVAIPKNAKKIGMFFEKSGIMTAHEAEAITTEEARLAMKERGIAIRNVLTVKSEGIVEPDGSLTVLAAALFDQR